MAAPSGGVTQIRPPRQIDVAPRAGPLRQLFQNGAGIAGKPFLGQEQDVVRSGDRLQRVQQRGPVEQRAKTVTRATRLDDIRHEPLPADGFRPDTCA